MGEIVNVEIIERDGQKYKVTTYDDGLVEEIIYYDNPPEPTPEPEPEPTDTEMIMDAIATVYEAVLENKE